MHRTIILFNPNQIQYKTKTIQFGNLVSIQIFLFLGYHDISNSLYYLCPYYVFQYDVSERPDLVTRLKMKIYRTTWKPSGEPFPLFSLNNHL